jgi:hypothetical protein
MSRAATVRCCLACSLAAAAAASAGAQALEPTGGRTPAGSVLSGTPAGSADETKSLTVPLRAAAPDATGVDLLLKLRTRGAALERGLGTSGTDYAAQLKFVRPLGSFSAFGRFAYHGSDLHASSSYGEPWRAEFGGTYQFTANHEAGASMELRQPTGGSAPVRELSAFGALRFGDWRYQLSMTRSLMQGSPDMSVSVSVRRRF